MAALVFGATGTIVLAGSGLTPARLLLVPAGTRLPPGVRPVAAVPARAMGLVARAAAGAGHAITTSSTARACLAIGDGDATTTREGVLASLPVDDVTTMEGVLAYYPVDDVTTMEGVLAYHPVDDVTTMEGVLTYHPVDDVTKDGALASLSLPVVGSTNGGRGALSTLNVVASSNGNGAGGALSSLPAVGSSTRAAAVFPARASAGPSLLFFGGLGISSSAAGGRASRGGRLVVAATAGSEADGEADDNDGYSTKVDLFLKKKEEVLLSWEFVHVDKDYNPQGFFADVEMFKESADEGMNLTRLLLDRGLDYSNDQMWVLSYAGQCLRRVAIQAEAGYVYDGAVMEATQAVKLVCLKLVPDVPTASTSDPIVAYAKQRAEDFVKIIDGVKAAVVTD